MQKPATGFKPIEVVDPLDFYRAKDDPELAKAQALQRERWDESMRERFPDGLPKLDREMCSRVGMLLVTALMCSAREDQKVWRVTGDALL